MCNGTSGNLALQPPDSGSARRRASRNDGPTRFVSRIDRCYRLDLDQPARPHQAADDDERAGRRIFDIEIAIAYRTQLRHGGLVDLGCEVIIQLDDIRHGAAGGFDCNLEIAKDLFDLRFEIAFADHVAGRIARYLAGKVDDRPVMDLGDM